jgi:hypothetical protein
MTMSLVDWRNEMEYRTTEGETLRLEHPIGDEMTVTYQVDTSYTSCRPWPTAGQLNKNKEIEQAKKWFEILKKKKTKLETLESAREFGFYVEGYTTLKHAALLREAGRIKEAKKMSLDP